jgi:RNA polymerase sigma-70 factor (ECF subfamily)
MTNRNKIKMIPDKKSIFLPDDMDASDKPKLEKMTDIPNRRDDDLIKDFLDNCNNKSFEELISRHLTWLRRMLSGIFAGNIEDMEDAQQEILIRLYTDLSNFKFKSSFKTFFYRYARNKAIDLLRKNISRNKKENKISEDFFANVPYDSHNEAELNIHNEEITGALMKLDVDSRSIIIMKEIENMTIKDIVDVTGLPEGTVKSTLHRAREKLINLLNWR